MFLNLLLDTGRPVADFISKWFPVIQTILIILITLFAVAILIAVLAQPSKPAGGNNVILGTNSDSYFSKNKSSSREGRLNKIIVISAICIFALTIIYFVSFGIYSGI